ncbi:MAG: hypothetical protein RML92_09225 [Bacteroidia bacterium]|nr:hypothetical protein [Bacteroidia bacterium]
MNQRKSKLYWVGVVGDAGEACTPEKKRIAYQLGYALAEAGYGIITGGMGGVMEAACQGARAFAENAPCLGILPMMDRSKANPYTWAIPTPLGEMRNALVAASCDALVAIGGGAGTLSEIAFAWMYGKPILAFKVDGWSGRLAGQTLDHRRPDPIYSVESPQEVLHILEKTLLI